MLQTLNEHFIRASQQGFPAFPNGEAASSPVNAAPFVASFDDLVGTTGGDPVRASLLEALASVLEELRTAGIAVRVGLIGGSFLDHSVTPRDLDVVLFYEHAVAGLELDLRHLVHRLPQRGIDARLVPIDVSPVIFLNSAIYFALLYSRTKGGATAAKGCVLVAFGE